MNSFPMVMMGSDGGPESSPPPEVSLAACQDVAQYIKKVVTAMFDTESTGTALDLALTDRTHLDSIQKFIADPQIRSLLVQSSSTKGEQERNSTSWGGKMQIIMISMMMMTLRRSDSLLILC